MKIEIGTLVNDRRSFSSILLQSEIRHNRLWVYKDAKSAADGWNRLMGNMDGDVALLVHQDVYLPPGWMRILEKRLGDIPDKSWMVAGFYGINEKGEYCGKIHDRRIPTPMITNHKLPCKALSVDGCCMAIKLPFEFDETLAGFDLYDVYASLWARANGLTSWIVDCMPEHYPTRSWDWKPDALFMENWNWLRKEFPTSIIMSTCYR